MPTVNELAKALQEAVAALQRVLSTHHAAVRGTYEASLAEAQGAQMFQGGAGKVVGHLQSLRQGSVAISNRLATVESLMGKLKGIDPNVGGRIRHALDQLLGLARDRVDLARRTTALVEELEASAPRALEGLPLSTGERSLASMASQQVASFRDEVRAAFPSFLPRARMASAAVRDLLSRIRQLPETLEEAEAEASAGAIFARASIASAVASATAPGVLRTVGTALQSLWTVGGRLISVPLLVIPLDEDGNVLGMPGAAGPGKKLIL